MWSVENVKHTSAPTCPHMFKLAGWYLHTLLWSGLTVNADIVSTCLLLHFPSPLQVSHGRMNTVCFIERVRWGLLGVRFFAAYLAKNKQRAGWAASPTCSAEHLPLRPLMTLSLALIPLRQLHLCPTPNPEDTRRISFLFLSSHLYLGPFLFGVWVRRGVGCTTVVRKQCWMWLLRWLPSSLKYLIFYVMTWTFSLAWNSPKGQAGWPASARTYLSFLSQYWIEGWGHHAWLLSPRGS